MGLPQGSSGSGVGAEDHREPLVLGGQAALLQRVDVDLLGHAGEAELGRGDLRIAPRSHHAEADHRHDRGDDRDDDHHLDQGDPPSGVATDASAGAGAGATRARERKRTRARTRAMGTPPGRVPAARVPADFRPSSDLCGRAYAKVSDDARGWRDRGDMVSMEVLVGWGRAETARRGSFDRGGRWEVGEGSEGRDRGVVRGWGRRVSFVCSRGLSGRGKVPAILARRFRRATDSRGRRFGRSTAGDHSIFRTIRSFFRPRGRTECCAA